MLGCSGNASEEAIAGRQLPIYGGTASGPEDDFVLRIEAINSLGLKLDCSGSLVHARLVLTARHCVVHFNPPPFLCGANGEIVSDGDGGKFGTAHDPTQVSVFQGPGYPLEAVARGTQIVTTEAPSICRDDVAFVVLDQPLAAPAAALRLFQPVEEGEPVSVVGYGVGESEGKVFRKRVSGLPVESVGPEQVDPADDSMTPPRSIALGRSTCYGDSGGPVLSDETSAILAVTSWSSQDCEQENVRNFFPRIAPHADVVSAAFAAVEAEPLIEDVTGDSCTSCEDSSGCAVSGTTGREASGAQASAFWLMVFGLLRLRGKTARST